MGAARIIILAAAAVAAIGLAFVVRQMATAARHPPPIRIAAQTAQQIPTVRVLVAAHDLPVGTHVTGSDVSWQIFPAAGTNPAWIVDHTPAAAPIGPAVARADVSAGAAVSEVAGAVVREAFLAGEPMVSSKLARAAQGGYLSVALQPGMRAVAIPINAQTGVGGFILPGDRVDVLLTRKGNSSGAVETVLRNVHVLAIDQQSQAPKNTRALVGGSATLEVPAQDVEVLLGAETRGDLALALRSYADLAGGSERAMGGGDVVTFIKGGQVSEAAAP